MTSKLSGHGTQLRFISPFITWVKYKKHIQLDNDTGLIYCAKKCPLDTFLSTSICSTEEAWIASIKYSMLGWAYKNIPGTTENIWKQ